jgi:hypothetical protein
LGAARPIISVPQLTGLKQSAAPFTAPADKGLPGTTNLYHEAANDILAVRVMRRIQKTDNHYNTVYQDYQDGRCK